MTDRLSRRTLGKATAAAAALAVSRVWRPAQATTLKDKTLRFIAQADLRILDPIWTTALLNFLASRRGRVIVAVRAVPRAQGWSLV